MIIEKEKGEKFKIYSTFTNVGTDTNTWTLACALGGDKDFTWYSSLQTITLAPNESKQLTWEGLIPPNILDQTTQLFIGDWYRDYQPAPYDFYIKVNPPTIPLKTGILALTWTLNRALFFDVVNVGFDRLPFTGSKNIELPIGNYHLIATFRDYIIEEDIIIAEGQETKIYFDVSKGDLNCHAFSNGEETTTPIRIVRVGRFYTPFIRDLHPGSYHLIAYHEEQIIEKDIIINPHETTRVDFGEAPILPEGFLQITNIDAPIQAEEGSTINFTIHAQNLGEADNFKSTSNEVSTEPFYLESGQSVEINNELVMPNQDLVVNVATYHEE